VSSDATGAQQKKHNEGAPTRCLESPYSGVAQRPEETEPCPVPRRAAPRRHPPPGTAVAAIAAAAAADSTKWSRDAKPRHQSAVAGAREVDRGKGAARGGHHDTAASSAPQPSRGCGGCDGARRPVAAGGPDAKHRRGGRSRRPGDRHRRRSTGPHPLMQRAVTATMTSRRITQAAWTTAVIVAARPVRTATPPNGDVATHLGRRPPRLTPRAVRQLSHLVRPAAPASKNIFFHTHRKMYREAQSPAWNGVRKID